MRSVREFLGEAFSYLGMDLQNDPRYFRPTEVDSSSNAPSAAASGMSLLSWTPRSS